MIEPKRPKVSPAQSKRAYELVKERSFGLCEICGDQRAAETHHRLHKSHGGPDRVENLIHVCGRGNHTGCHGDAHSATDRYVKGWAVRSGFNPAHQPVLYRGRFVFLLPDGGIEDMGEVNF